MLSFPHHGELHNEGALLYVCKIPFPSVQIKKPRGPKVIATILKETLFSVSFKPISPLSSFLKEPAVKSKKNLGSM